MLPSRTGQVLSVATHCASVIPQPQVQPGDIPRFDAVTQVNSVAAAFYDINAGRKTNLQASFTYSAGSHDIKAGYDFKANQKV